MRQLFLYLNKKLILKINHQICFLLKKDNYFFDIKIQKKYGEVVKCLSN